MNAVSIGKGLWRVNVRSRKKRERLSRTPGVQIEGDRVIFPEELYGALKYALTRESRKRKQKPEQTRMKF
jgi:hypothetical protein